MNGGLYLDLNLFKNLKKDIESNVTIKNFMDELADFLKDVTSSIVKNNNISNEKEIDTKEIIQNKENTVDKDKHRKEGHLYFVTEDRLGEVFLWDFTDKPEYEFKEIFTSEELLNVAKEGAMLQYKNGKYELYSPYGYDMLFGNEKNVEVKDN